MKSTYAIKERAMLMLTHFIAMSAGAAIGIVALALVRAGDDR
jgi:hypothetical protein